MSFVLRDELSMSSSHESLGAQIETLCHCGESCPSIVDNKAEYEEPG
jgi:hypothetical protein